MLDTPVVTETDFGLPATYAFRIAGEVTKEDMRRMSERVLDAFDRHDKIDLVLIFDRFEGSEAGASLSAPAIKAQAKSLWSIRNYVTVAAPERAAEMIEAMGKVMPVDPHAFATESEARAWLAEQPRLD